MEQIIDVKNIRTPETIVAEIRATEEYACRSVVLAAAKIGQDLKELKELVGHGNFLPYIADHLDYSDRKAQQMMQIADKFADEGSAFSRLVSNPHTCADLSISKALKLLAVPENEVEDFVETHNVDSMTNKELEEEIKRYKSDAERLEKRLKESTDAQAEKIDKIDLLKKQLKELNDASQESREKEAELEAVQGELEKLKKEKSDLKEKIKKIQSEKDAEIKAAKEATVMEAKEQAEKELEAEMNVLREQTRQEKEKADAAVELARAAEEKLNNVAESTKAKAKAAASLSIRGKLLSDTFDQIVEDVRALESKEERKTLKAAITQMMETIGKKIEAI